VAADAAGHAERSHPRALVMDDGLATLIAALVWMATGLALLGAAPLVQSAPASTILLAVAGLGALIGFAIGLAVFLAMRRSRRRAAAAAEAGAQQLRAAAAAEMREAALADTRLLLFMQQLLAATTTDRFRTVVLAGIQQVVGARKIWIASTLGGRRVILRSDDSSAGPLSGGAAQQWTTFPLRIDQKDIGVLGVESAVALPPDLTKLLQLLAPSIAHALHTTHFIDTLREAAHVDLLTGAATRREGMTRLQAEIKRAQRTGSPMAVLMLDLDRFKAVNDRFGHETGDAILAAVGRILLSTLRASDVRCRWGGEEFLVVLPDTDLARAQIVASGLLRNVGAAQVLTPQGPVSVSASIGVTIARPGESNLEGIIRRADAALYDAKAAGRSCLRVRLSKEFVIANAAEARRPPEQHGSSVTLPFAERRDPTRADRRRVPSPGRRRTDTPFAR
jgi:diguanylate cyclase (GGDEF)-like protein